MKHKLKALASLCLALALTLCLTLPAWAVGEGDTGSGNTGLTENSTGSITVSGLEAGVTVNVYRLMTVNVDGIVHQPQMPVYTWVPSVGNWLKSNTNETYKTYISEAKDDYSVTENFKDNGETNAADIAAFYDSLAAAIREKTITGLTPQTGKASQDVGQSTASCTIESLPMGNYLVLIEGGMQIYRPSAFNLVPEWKPGEGDTSGEWVLNDASVKLKSSSLGITKTVVDGVYTQETNIDQPDGKKYAQVAIGDTVTYILEADVPQYPASATATGYYISDNLPDGMTVYLERIYVYGVNAANEVTALVAPQDYVSTVTEPQRPTGEVNEKNVDFVLSFVYDEIKDYSKIRVVYTALANKGITVVPNSQSTNVNQNIAYLDYNNNPYETPAVTWETDSDTADVYTYGIQVQKKGETQEGTTNDNLPGAVFELTAADDDGNFDSTAAPIKFVPTTPDTDDGEYRKAVTDNDANVTTELDVGNAAAQNPGQLQLSGLDVGTYYLKEIKAPDGYNLLAQPVKITITDDGLVENTLAVNGKPEYTDSEKKSEVEADDGYVPVTVINTQGFTLPTTGGMGTVLFTAGGVVLMGAGLVLLVVFLRRRRAK